MAKTLLAYVEQLNESLGTDLKPVHDDAFDQNNAKYIAKLQREYNAIYFDGELADYARRHGIEKLPRINITGQLDPQTREAFATLSRLPADITPDSFIDEIKAANDGQDIKVIDMSQGWTAVGPGAQPPRPLEINLNDKGLETANKLIPLARQISGLLEFDASPENNKTPVIALKEFLRDNGYTTPPEGDTLLPEPGEKVDANQPNFGYGLTKARLEFQNALNGAEVRRLTGSPKIPANGLHSEEMMQAYKTLLEKIPAEELAAINPQMVTFFQHYEKMNAEQINNAQLSLSQKLAEVTNVFAKAHELDPEHEKLPNVLMQATPTNEALWSPSLKLNAELIDTYFQKRYRDEIQQDLGYVHDGVLFRNYLPADSVAVVQNYKGVFHDLWKIEQQSPSLDLNNKKQLPADSPVVELQRLIVTQPEELLGASGMQHLQLLQQLQEEPLTNIDIDNNSGDPLLAFNLSLAENNLHQTILNKLVRTPDFQAYATQMSGKSVEDLHDNLDNEFLSQNSRDLIDIARTYHETHEEDTIFNPVELQAVNALTKLNNDQIKALQNAGEKQTLTAVNALATALGKPQADQSTLVKSYVDTITAAQEMVRENAAFFGALKKNDRAIDDSADKILQAIADKGPEKDPEGNVLTIEQRIEHVLKNHEVTGQLSLRPDDPTMLALSVFEHIQRKDLPAQHSDFDIKSKAEVSEALKNLNGTMPLASPSYLAKFQEQLVDHQLEAEKPDIIALQKFINQNAGSINISLPPALQFKAPIPENGKWDDPAFINGYRATAAFFQKEITTNAEHYARTSGNIDKLNEFKVVPDGAQPTGIWTQADALAAKRIQNAQNDDDTTNPGMIATFSTHIHNINSITPIINALSAQNHYIATGEATKDLNIIGPVVMTPVSENPFISNLPSSKDFLIPLYQDLAKQPEDAQSFFVRSKLEKFKSLFEDNENFTNEVNEFNQLLATDNFDAAAATQAINNFIAKAPSEDIKLSVLKTLDDIELTTGFEMDFISQEDFAITRLKGMFEQLQTAGVEDPSFDRMLEQTVEIMATATQSPHFKDASLKTAVTNMNTANQALSQLAIIAPHIAEKITKDTPEIKEEKSLDAKEKPSAEKAPEPEEKQDLVAPKLLNQKADQSNPEPANDAPSGLPPIPTPEISEPAPEQKPSALSGQPFSILLPNRGDSFFDPAVYRMLGEIGKVDGGLVGPEHKGITLNREDLAKIALEKMETLAADLGIDKKNITEAMFEGNFNPDPADVVLAWEALGDETQRNQAWAANYGAIRDLDRSTINVNGQDISMTDKDIALRMLCKTTSPERLERVYGFDGNDPSLSYNEALEILKETHPDHIEGFERKISEMMDQSPVTYFDLRYYDMGAAEASEEGFVTFNDYIQMREAKYKPMLERSGVLKNEEPPQQQQPNENKKENDKVTLLRENKEDFEQFHKDNINSTPAPAAPLKP